MRKCNCYRETPCMRWDSVAQDWQEEIYKECYGTKERELCTCDGDESKCNFYPEKRDSDLNNNNKCQGEDNA